MLTLDHLAISGETLADATQYAEEQLGVQMQPGGQHDVFFTHNTLLGLEDGLYLEAIAINPDAPVPDRPRWFDLDRFTGAARLTNWICRTGDLGAALQASDLHLGAPVELQRGDLRWSMAVPANGQLPFDACAPALITWHTPQHPAQMLSPSGIRLRRLTLTHPDAAELQQALAPMLRDDRLAFETGPRAMHATFGTPHGPRSLSG